MFFALLPLCSTMAATSRASDYVSANTYNNLYPYMNNTMRTQLNPGVTPSNSNAQINVLARTKSNGTAATRNVVPRRATTTTSAHSATTGASTARSATSARAATATRNVSARRATSGTSTARAATPTSSSTRRVVARSGTGTTAMRAGQRTTRGNGTSNVSTARQTSTGATYVTDSEPVTSSRCMADYVECMDSYCERADTEYNRCYCSSKLAQINAKHKPEIDRLIKEILTAQGTNQWTQDEMDEYWEDVVNQYTGTNSWANLEEALDIDWASTESTVRGQQAFAMGHQYCSQHLRGCAYMQNNLRDAYRSEIARDCAAYESSLQILKNVAESVAQAYKNK